MARGARGLEALACVTWPVANCNAILRMLDGSFVKFMIELF